MSKIQITTYKLTNLKNGLEINYTGFNTLKSVIDNMVTRQMPFKIEYVTKYL